MAVAVVVNKTATRTPSLGAVAQPGRFRNVSESAIPVIAVKQILSPSRDKDVLESVVVVVADADAAAPTVVDESRFLGDIGETTIPVVVIKAVGRRGRACPESVARKYEQVHPPIIVIIDKGAATADRLHDVIVVIGASIDGSLFEPSARGYIY